MSCNKCDGVDLRAFCQRFNEPRGYSTLIGDLPVTINVRDYEQYNWKNFFHGNAAIASFTAVFPAAQAMESSAAKGMKD